MKYFLYDIFFHFLFALTLPYYLFKSVTTGKYREGIPERFGFISGGKLEKFSGPGQRVWIHAVSVGETKAVIPLVKRFRERWPGIRVLFSTTTLTGQMVAEKEGAGLFDALIYCPLDFSWAVKGIVERIAPDIFIVVEKEVWPNLYRVLGRARVPVIVVNGTISERSFRRFSMLRGFFAGIFGAISFFCARTDHDLERAVSLGVGKERAALVGNIKFDLDVDIDGKKAASLARALGIGPGERVIVAGSTHAGEEEMILQAFKRLLGEFKGIKLILAPRHPERFAGVEALIKRSGLTCSRRTAGGGGLVTLLDTIGELMTVYSLSDFAFVGGSLVKGVGGHNLLEPAAFGKPVLYGPFLTTYLTMAGMLEEAAAGIRVKDGDDFYINARRLLTDEALRRNTGAAALHVVEANRGAIKKTLDIIDGFLH